MYSPWFKGAKLDSKILTETALFLGRKQIFLIYSDMLFLLHAVDLQTEPGVANKLRLKIDDALLNKGPVFFLFK